MFDLVIRNGQILDGSGGPPQQRDVAVIGDTICALDDLANAEARHSLDAAGRYVCPGFIDVHSHSDAFLLLEPSAPSKIHQGVTTEVVGNCGAGTAPLTPLNHMPSDWQDKTFPGAWRTLAEYRALLARVGPAVNVVQLVGHNTLRAAVMGYENRPPSADELRQMLRLLEECLDAGARGLSSGLIYSPGMFSSMDELVELARVVAARRGLYTTHMRSEGARLLESIDETLAIARATGVRVEISHLKTSGPANWSKVEPALDRIRTARQSGIEAAADRYPYIFAGTDLDVILPDWASAGTRREILARLREPGERARIRTALLAERSEGSWSSITIGSTAHAENRPFQGMGLVEAAQCLALEPVDMALRLMETDELRTSAFFAGMCEENMYRIFREPYVMIGSDASIRAPQGVLSLDHPHPRAYGTFPRFLRMALDGKTVPLQEAVRKATSLPAEHFRIPDRGRVATGCKADLVVFDPATLRDTATCAAPHQLAQGIDHVLVNGVPTLEHGRLTGRRAGQIL